MMLNPKLVAALAAHGIAIDQGYQWLPVARLLQQYHPQVEVELPLLISDVSRQSNLIQLQQCLTNAYPAGHPAMILVGSSAQADTVLHCTQICLEELNSVMVEGDSCLLCLPPLPTGSSFTALQAVVAHLRAPEGCPWDRQQTLATMRHDLLDECAEVLEAIDLDGPENDNGAHIAEELGDLFMAGVLMVQIATEAGRFQLADAMHSIVTKLIRRHPHVFGDVVVDGVEMVLSNWDAIKAQEKAAKGITAVHPLAGVPAALPALEKARELQSKAAKAGLLDRMALAATALQQLPWLQPEPTASALGATLWQLVALAHQSGINAEDALRSFCVNFRAQYEAAPNRR
ncbi:MAG: MazG family protein [Caldilineaceae bacterium]